MRLAAVFGVLLSGILGFPGDSFGQSDGPSLVDDFDGKLGLAWKPLHPDPTHFSLSSHPGELTIRTQVGSMHRDAQARLIPPVKNLYLLDNPMASERGSVVTTCLNSFRPTMPWQQAGLILYNDEDNYLKWVCQSSRTGVPEWNLLREVDGKSSITKHADRRRPAGKDVVTLNPSWGSL